MPIYTYQCKCGYEEEVFNIPTMTCPTCNKKMTRLLGSFLPLVDPYNFSPEAAKNRMKVKVTSV